MGNCKFKNCIITEDESLLNQSSAIVFSPHAFRQDGTNRLHSVFGKTRNTSQIWIVKTIESPLYVPRVKPVYDGVFNISVTYSGQSGVGYRPYSKIVRLGQPAGQLRINTTRSKLVAWMVSNCDPPSQRNVYADELRRHIDVDVYGKCGNRKCGGRYSWVSAVRVAICNRPLFLFVPHPFILPALSQSWAIYGSCVYKCMYIHTCAYKFTCTGNFT